MKLPRRTFLHLAAGAAVLPAMSRIAMAQTYPARPVRLVVAFAAGGPNDILARLIGQWLSERLGQPFVIDNRPGSGSAVARKRSCVRPPTAIRCFLPPLQCARSGPLSEPRYDFIRDTAPVAGVAFVPIVMVVAHHRLSKPSPTSWPMPRSIQPRPRLGRRSPDHRSSWRRRCSRQ